ncbi:ATP-binding cassette domain-containing protein [Streptomyces albofaciens JCM 4342]|uniref:ATP-binding cassette domain-containing protein n=1 Tax=Streptomyces albofaciens TaxID=66866 RepID=UPI001238D5E0|nr:ATP-binding cassette domain-containing protein [Streptomyces albofaciens]KAA6221790.1 ATP-binding cassette domain-containing protein [Streptomyces albofaciens JCM 4342]
MDTTRQGAAVNARGIGVKGPRGWAFRDVHITAEPGSLIAVEGPSGSGRTCLLLALTGRMQLAEGHATVAGFPLPKRMGTVRRLTAIAHVPGVADLEPALTAGEHLEEQALLGHRVAGSLGARLPWGRRYKEATRARVDAALAAVGLDPTTLPKGLRTAVRDMERIEALRLSVALAVMHGPRLVAIDDVDLKLSADERSQVWQMLRDLALNGTTVVAAASTAPGDAIVVRTAPAAAKPDAQAPAAATPTTSTTGQAGTTDTNEEEAAHAIAEARRA